MTQTTKKIALCIGLFVFLVFIIWAYCFNHDDKVITPPPVKENITVQSFQTEIGWGYRIVIDNKTFINQPFIPVIGGHKGFPTRESAEKIGQIIVERLKNHEKPIITVTDLKNSDLIR